MDLKFNLPYHEKWSVGKLSKLGFFPMRLFIWVSQLHLEMHQFLVTTYCTQTEKIEDHLYVGFTKIYLCFYDYSEENKCRCIHNDNVVVNNSCSKL